MVRAGDNITANYRYVPQEDIVKGIKTDVRFDLNVARPF
jgi:hypothetical protein